VSTLTQPLRDEHKELLPHLEHILALADEIAEGGNPRLAERVNRIHGFLRDDLLHHAHVEEQVLYPVVARVLGATEATATMSRDHVEIGRLVEQLGAVTSQLADGTIGRGEVNELRRLLCGLHAVVRLHFLKEEEVYMPLLDARLTEAEGAALLEAVEGACRST